VGAYAGALYASVSGVSGFPGDVIGHENWKAYTTSMDGAIICFVHQQLANPICDIVSRTTINILIIHHELGLELSFFFDPNQCASL